MTTRNLFFGALALSGLVFFSGCAIVTKIPANRFDSPEAIGHGDELQGGLEGGNQWVITEDDTQNPPNLSNPSFEGSTNDFFVNGGLSLSALTSRLDLDVKLRFNSVFLGQLKFQLIGAPRTTAREGNFSVAITAAAGGASHTSSDTNAPLFGGTSTTANNSFNESAIDFGLIMGYRVSEWALLYSGISWTRQTYSGTLSQTVGGGSATNYLYSGQLRQSGVDLGVELDPGLMVAKLEYAFASTKSVNTSQQYSNGYVGFELGFRFGSGKPLEEPNRAPPEEPKKVTP